MLGDIDFWLSIVFEKFDLMKLFEADRLGYKLSVKTLLSKAVYQAPPPIVHRTARLRLLAVPARRVTVRSFMITHSIDRLKKDNPSLAAKQILEVFAAEWKSLTPRQLDLVSEATEIYNQSLPV
jgi:hypothetical protein